MKPVTFRSRSMDPAGRCAAWHISHIVKAFYAKTAQIPYACEPRPQCPHLLGCKHQPRSQGHTHVWCCSLCHSLDAAFHVQAIDGALCASQTHSSFFFMLSLN